MNKVEIEMLPGVQMSPEELWSFNKFLKENATIKIDDYVTRDDDLWNTVTKELVERLEKGKENDAAIKELKATLVSMAGDSNVRGGGISLSKSIRKGHIEYAKVPELQNVDLEAYRKEAITVWTVNQE